MDVSVEAAVAEKLAAEKKDLSARISNLDKSQKELQKKYDGFDHPVSKILRSKVEPMPDKDQKVLIQWGHTGQALRATIGAIKKARRDLARLDDEAEIESRINRAAKQHERFAQLRATHKTPSTRRPRMAEKKEATKEQVDKIVALVRDAKGTASAREIADALNKAKVTAPAPRWDARVVRSVIDSKGGGWVALREKYAGEKISTPGRAAAASGSAGGKKRGAAKRSSAKTKTAPAGNGNKKRAAAPLSKQAQASGTSRGGTGKRGTGKNMAARARTSARKSGTSSARGRTAPKSKRR